MWSGMGTCGVVCSRQTRHRDSWNGRFMTCSDSDGSSCAHACSGKRYDLAADGEPGTCVQQNVTRAAVTPPATGDLHVYLIHSQAMDDHRRSSRSLFTRGAVSGNNADARTSTTICTH